MADVGLALLLDHFHTIPQYRNRNLTQAIENKCFELLSRDYNVKAIKNLNGELCSTYPESILIIESAKHNDQKVNDVTKLKELFEISKTSRVRNRFPVPVILFNNKNICRSSTLAQKIECITKVSQTKVREEEANLALMDYNRMCDIRLIKELKVKNICDLMVEDKKKKYFVNVASSEKVDSLRRYNEFFIASLPYPGCEFFKIYKDHQYNGERLYFQWDDSHCKLQFLGDPKDKIQHFKKSFGLHHYTNWDLCELTQRYLKVLLYFLVDNGSNNSEGLLVHCISGWDRTPMFISLLRMTLWADGMIHQGLSASEMLFLTIAYDWLLFQHDLPDRTCKGEDIFYFCFDFLCKIQSDDFSIQTIQQLYDKNITKLFKSRKREDPPPVITNHIKTNTITIFSDYDCNSCSATSPQSLLVPIQHPSNPIAINNSHVDDDNSNSFEESYGSSWEPVFADDLKNVIVHALPDVMEDYNGSNCSPSFSSIIHKKRSSIEYDFKNDDNDLFFDLDLEMEKEFTRKKRIKELRELFIKSYRKYL